MDTELPWRMIWEESKRTAIHYCDDGRYPQCRVERAIASLERLYGEEWIQNVVTNGHPLIQLMFYWPGVREFTEYFELIAFAAGRTNEAPVADMIARTKSSSWLHFNAVLEELRVLYCFNRVGLSARQLPERQKQSKKHPFTKTQDLAIDWEHAPFHVEVTQLLATEEMGRADQAWRRLTDLHHRWAGRGTLQIASRPFSERHIAYIEQQMLKAITHASETGVATYVDPGVISYVIWKDSHEQAASRILSELELETGRVSMAWRFRSPASPFRVIQKITEKRAQSSQVPWLLVIRATDGLPDEAHATELADQVSEYIYDHEYLVGVVLYYRWQFWGDDRPAAMVNMDNQQMTVITTEGDGSYQQTILLKNRFCAYAKTPEVYERVHRIGVELGWDAHDAGVESSSAPNS
jgi:hypothetical protein